MAFRDLFFKPANPKTAKTPASTIGRSPVADEKASGGPANSVDLLPVEDGPIHLPHRGLAPFKPQAHQFETPSHIPYRGLAPFRPSNREGVASQSSDTAPGQAPAAVVPQAEARSVVEAPSAPALVSPQVERPSPLTKPISQPRQKVDSEEVRERPREGKRTVKPRIPRHSSGWAAMLKHLKEVPSQRVLDIGPTSPNNINFLTGLGHSVYMADVVQEALEDKWTLTRGDEEEDGFDEEGFCDRHFNFHDRRFDVVLLWTTIDYLPGSLIPAIIARLHECMERGGQLLAFFHTRTAGPETAFCRYHLVDSTNIDTQENSAYPVLRVSTNREIERLFKNFSGCKFFLARDNVYEVIITR